MLMKSKWRRFETSPRAKVSMISKENENSQLSAEKQKENLWIMREIWFESFVIKKKKVGKAFGVVEFLRWHRDRMSSFVRWMRKWKWKMEIFCFEIENSTASTDEFRVKKFHHKINTHFWFPWEVKIWKFQLKNIGK